MASNNRNRGAEAGNLSLVRGVSPTFSRIEDPYLDDLPETFIDRYRNWGTTVTDAPSQYHTLNAVVMLSTIICPYTALATSYGLIRPNIWSMILAGTTITRKSTTMDMAKSMLTDIGLDYLMGTDGSPEGLLSEMQDRDGRVSMFHRDEITGWIEGMKKDYMSGLLESFTRMYDGMEEMRILRSGKIEVKKPRLVILSGGIKTRMQELITMDHIRSGFIPRFIMVSGTTTPDKVRPIGPPPNTNHAADPRDTLLAELQEIVAFWIPQTTSTTVSIGSMSKQVVAKQADLTMHATPDAWTRIRQLKQDAIEMGERTSSVELFTPILDRLSNSVIKVAMLICGARKATQVEYQDVVQAIRYSQEWLDSAMEFARAVEAMPDMNPWEKKADKIVMYVRKNAPNPTTRSDVMRRFHVRTRDVADVEQTLVSRGHIHIKTIGGGGTGLAARGRVEYHIVDSKIAAEDTIRPRSSDSREATEETSSSEV